MHDTGPCLERSQVWPATDFSQPLMPCRARPLARCSTAGRYPMKGLQHRVWSGRWCPHSNHCSALAALRTTHTADRKVSFRQVATQRQLVCRARQPGRTKNRLRSCRTRGERPRPSGDTRPQRRRGLLSLLPWAVLLGDGQALVVKRLHPRRVVKINDWLFGVNGDWLAGWTGARWHAAWTRVCLTL